MFPLQILHWTWILSERRVGLLSFQVKDDVDRIFALSDFGDFNDGLEDIHDQIHGWTGGTMGRVATAAFDPIFWSHHCMIDRIWWLWQLRHGNSGIPQDMLDTVLEPFNLNS